MAKKTSKRKTLNILDKNKKHSQFDYTEIFRHIRTNIEFSTVDKDIKSICITSSQANEAKTTLSINLAYIFVQVVFFGFLVHEDHAVFVEDNHPAGLADFKGI